MDEVRYGQKDVPGVNPPPARSEPLPPRLVSRHEQGADRWIAEDWLDWLRKRVRLAMDLLCSPTVPHEKGPDVPSAYGILSHALAVVGLRQRGVSQHPDGPEAAALAEIDRLRTEVKQLRARVREWEAVNADLAARCDSGDIPIRLGERYSQAVLREIDRLRAALGPTPNTGDAS